MDREDSDIIAGGFTGKLITNARRFEPDNKVLLRIVTTFREKSIVKKTHCQLASRIRWDVFENYWNWLQEKGYIQKLNEEGDHVVTSQGNELFTLFLNYHNMVING